MANGIINMSSKKSVIDHTRLINRNLPNQHPISAISGLQSHLDNNTKQINIKLDKATQELKNTAKSIQNNLTDRLSDLQTTVDVTVDQLSSEIDNQQAQIRTLNGNISEVQTNLKTDLSQLEHQLSTNLDTLSQKTTEDLLEVNTNLEDLAQTIDATFANYTTTEDLTSILAAKADANKVVSNDTFTQFQTDNNSAIATAKLEAIDAAGKAVTDAGYAVAATVDATISGLDSDIKNIKNTLGIDMESDADPDNPEGSSLLDRVTQLENFVGGTSEGDTLASQIAALSTYIDSLHPLVLTVGTANQVKHFTESKSYTVSWKTNRSLSTNKMYIAVGAADPQEVIGVSTSTAEVNYATKINIGAASPAPEMSSSTSIKISELKDGIGLNKTITITDTHYVYFGMSNIELNALTDADIKALGSTLQTTATKNETTYSGATSTEPKYLYYIVPEAYTKNKKLVCKFSQGISEFEEASRLISLTYTGTSVNYAIYKITSDKQTGPVTMAVSVEPKS